ncbi:MAG: NUDIX domain-containing protein [Planctomycetota bacterium]
MKTELIVRGVAGRDGNILACIALPHNYRYLPGGHVDPGESARVALAREFMEEVGVEVRVGELLFTAEERFEQRGRVRHEIVLAFHVEHSSGEWPADITSREDDIGFEWLTPDELAAANFLPASQKAWQLF